MNRSVKYLFILSIILMGCFSAKNSTVTNYAKQYSEADNYFIADCSVLNLNDSISEINYIINPRNLLFTKSEDINDFIARYQIKYILKENIDDEVVVDSATLKFRIIKSETKKQADYKVKIYVPFGKNYQLKVDFYDEHRGTRFNVLLPVLKSSIESSNYFSVINSKTKKRVTNYNIDTNYFQIINENIRGNLIVQAYNRDFEYPLPPFDIYRPSSFNYKPDSTFNIQPDSNNIYSFQTRKKGFYFIRQDTSNLEGLTLFHFGNHFPEILTTEDLVEATRYIATKSEFEILQKKEHAKKQLDEFWLTNSGTRERAREAIKTYYNRVKEANLHFSSYRPGWKTDRGMVYIVYGPPKVIYKTNKTERWYYGEDNTALSEDFTFYKINNRFSENAFRMERSSLYKNTWFKMVEAWRDGRVY